MSTGKPDGKARPSGKSAAHNDRQERLAQALRDNLARRKAQARSRQDDGAEELAPKRMDD